MKSVTINVGNTYATIDVDLPDSLISTILTIPVNTWTKIDPNTGRFLRKPIPVTKDIIFYTTDGDKSYIPSGVSGMVADWFDSAGWNVNFIDARTLSGVKVKYHWNEDIVLRDYQDEAVNILLDTTRGVYEIPTGGGKTIVAKKVIYSLGVKTLYLVPGVSLREQALNDFSDLTDSIGVLSKKGKEYKTYDITIATVSKLWNLYKSDKELFEKVVSQFDLLIGDEIHHTATLPTKKGQKTLGTWVEVFTKIPAYYKFGCTATPGEEESTNRLSLAVAVGRIVYKVPIDYLVQQGYLTKIDVHFYDIKVQNESFSWFEVYDNLISNEQFNLLIVELCRKYNSEGKSVVVFVDRIEDHAEVLLEMMPEAHLVYGGTSLDERKEIKDRLLNNEKLIVISSVYKEGVDIPSLDVGIIIGGVGEKTVTQKAGRLTRLFSGKDKGILVDFNHIDGKSVVSKKGNMYRKKGLLEIHSGKRKDIYKNLGFNIIEKGELNVRTA